MKNKHAESDNISRIHFTTLFVLTVFTAFSFAVTPGQATDRPAPYEKFDRSMFDKNSANITNKWFPLKPGARFVYAGSTKEDDGEQVPHRIVIHVTGLKKVIDGILTRVTWDLDFGNGELVEAELAFFAQDKNGNVWRMGEYPEEYEDGEMVENPAWIAGVQDARPGIAMQANPRLGTLSYSQGWAPAVDWTDRGKVFKTGLDVCVPMDCYSDVLIISESSRAEPDAYQLKYWASGLGNIKVGWTGEGEQTQEILDLVDYMELSSEELGKIHEKAFKLEKRAYKYGAPVYGKTTPMIQD